MRSVFFYHRETGDWHPLHLIVSDDQHLKLNTPDDHIPVDIERNGVIIDRRKHRVDPATREIMTIEEAKS